MFSKEQHDVSVSTKKEVWELPVERMNETASRNCGAQNILKMKIYIMVPISMFASLIQELLKLRIGYKVTSSCTRKNK
jgi:hypothetical protein